MDSHQCCWMQRPLGFVTRPATSSGSTCPASFAVTWPCHTMPRDHTTTNMKPHVQISRFSDLSGTLTTGAYTSRLFKHPKVKIRKFSYFEMPRPSEFHTSIKTLMPTAITLSRVPNAQVSTFPKFHQIYGIVNSKPCRSAVSSCGLLGLVWHRPAMSHMLCRFDKECTDPACRTVSVGSSGLLGQAAKECIAESTGGTGCLSIRRAARSVDGRPHGSTAREARA